MRLEKLKKAGLAALGGLATLAITAGGAYAATKDPLNSGDTAWMITSSALVLMMTIPGLGLFYGGMVRKKNVLATLAQSFGATALITVLWMVIGYSLAFTPNADAGGQPTTSKRQRTTATPKASSRRRQPSIRARPCGLGVSVADMGLA